MGVPEAQTADRPGRAPNWFYIVCALALVTVAASAVYWSVATAENGRWQFVAGLGMVDGRTGTVCTPSDCTQWGAKK